MATTTTNLGLIKPIGTEKALVSVINGNMDIIDNKVGAIPQNESVQSQITALNNQITNVTSVSLVTGLTLYKLGNMRIISGTNGSGQIPSAGIDIGETVLTPCYSKIRYYDGSSNVDGYLYVNYNKVYLKSINTSSVSGTYITGSIVYFV